MAINHTEGLDAVKTCLSTHAVYFYYEVAKRIRSERSLIVSFRCKEFDTVCSNRLDTHCVAISSFKVSCSEFDTNHNLIIDAQNLTLQFLNC